MTLGLFFGHNRLFASGVLAQTTSGFIFHDNFTRADGALGNGWVATEGNDLHTMSIVNNLATTSGGLVYGDMQQPSLSIPSESMIHFNYQISATPGAGSFIDVWEWNKLSPNQSNDGFRFSDNAAFSPFFQAWTGSNKTFEHGLGGSDAGSRVGWRLVTEVTASNSGGIQLTAYKTFLGLEGHNLAGNPTLVDSLFVSQSLLPALSPVVRFALGDGGQSLWEVFVCKRNVVVNGVPNGFKCLLIGSSNSGSLVTAVSGSATINVDSFGLPAVRLEVRDASNILVSAIQSGTYTTSSGIWGGDVFSFTAS